MCCPNCAESPTNPRQTPGLEFNPKIISLSCDSTLTRAVSEKIKSTLTTLPTEILALIVSYLIPKWITFPDLTSDIKARYALRKGGDKTETYWSVARFVGFSNPLETFCAAHVVPKWLSFNVDNDLLNFARTNPRVSEICDREIYRNVVLLDAPYERIWNALDTLARNGEVLQPLVKRLAARYTCRPEGKQIHDTFGWKWGIRNMLYDDLRGLRNLRRLEIDICHDSSQRWEWYQLLPKLPALTHLFLRGFQYMECELPYLPQVKEAHFNECSVLGHSANNGNSIRRVFQKFPSLHTLFIMNSKNVWGHIPEDVFEPFADTLHTLVWTGTGRELICQNALRRLKNLKHLKSNAYNSLIAGEIACSELSNLFSTLETVEYVYPAEGIWDEEAAEPQQNLGDWKRMLRRLAESCELDYTSVRVVDVSSIEYMPSPGTYKCEAQPVFDAAERRFEEIGVTCILPEYPRQDLEPEPEQEPELEPEQKHQQEFQQESQNETQQGPRQEPEREPKEELQQDETLSDHELLSTSSTMREEPEDIGNDSFLTDEECMSEFDDLSSDRGSDFEVSEDDCDCDCEHTTSCGEIRI
ncbi:hypothetical protein CGCF415_v006531 [Colletotrichum fructicola]|nr:hypothetical protein CGCF415_v006531 [Colletotrichum fructicola]KAF4938790.1 hypothetical protein CGCF245_v004176 [Colletotrichum fructicola]KAF5508001.1 hypothetical protein CGCF413_v003678 [Colletotrichum fructicola]